MSPRSFSKRWEVTEIERIISREIASRDMLMDDIAHAPSPGACAVAILGALRSAGYRIQEPRHVLMPETPDEAVAMLAISEAWLRERAPERLIESPR